MDQSSSGKAGDVSAARDDANAAGSASIKKVQVEVDAASVFNATSGRDWTETAMKG